MNFPTTVAAQTTAIPVSASSGSMAGNLTSTAFSLALVLAIIFAMAWLVRWMQRARIGGVSSLRITGGIQVGARERVLMVQAGDKHFLIGVAPGQVQALHVFDQPPVMAEAQTSELSPFAERLQQLIQAKVKK